MPEKDLVKVGCAWKKESKGAGNFFSGLFGRIPPGIVITEGTKFFIFENRKPTKDSSPTHFILVPDTRDPEKGGGGGEADGW